MSDAARQKLRRARQRDGLIVLNVTARHFNLVEKLIQYEVLTEDEALDRRHLDEAVSAILDGWLERLK